MAKPSSKYNAKLCEEKHEEIERWAEKFDKSLDRVFGRLNWFILTTVAALVGAIVDIVVRKG